MTKHRTFIPLLAASIVSHAVAAGPNIIHIMADDLGYGSVGFNGQALIQTPNLDALAATGMKFTNSTACPVCGPSRAMLMTGFHSGHTFIDRNDNTTVGFRPQDVTAGEVLQSAGYQTSIIGKWGFGGSGGNVSSNLRSNPTVLFPDTLPTRQGFNQFYGELSHARAQFYFVDSLWQNNSAAVNGVSLVSTGNTTATPTAAFTHDLYTARGLATVSELANQASPFYMQLSYTVPHDDIDAIASVPNGLEPYANNAWTQKQKQYAAMITRMDTDIGRLLARIDDPNNDGNTADSVRNNTLIIFTSDNGGTAADGSPLTFFQANGSLRGGKSDLYEGGIRVPMIASWPGTIAAGSTSALRTGLADFLPTVAELSGATAPVGMDGVSIAPTLLGSGVQKISPSMLFENYDQSGPDPDVRVASWAIVKGDNKLIRYENGDSEIYNIAADPSEQSPLNLTTNAALFAQLQSLAIEEGAGQADAYAVEYVTWVGADGASLSLPANWSTNTSASANWSASIRNSSAASSVAVVDANISTLGIEVRGGTALQTVRVEPGQTLHGRNEVRIAANGRIELDNATLSSNRWINIEAHGELSGSGSVVGTVYSSGTLSPTNTLAITGDLDQQGDVKVALRSQGDFDQLDVGGTVTLAGSITLSSSYAPDYLVHHNIIQAGAVVGHFETATVLEINSSKYLVVGYENNAVFVTAALPGDATLNGAVNFDDLLVLAQNYNKTNQIWASGDFTGDGLVNFDDLLRLAQNYGGASIGSDWTLAQSLVPEPACAAALLAGTLRNRRRRA